MQNYINLIILRHLMNFEIKLLTPFFYYIFPQLIFIMDDIDLTT